MSLVTATQFLRKNTHTAHVALEHTPLARDLMCPELTVPRYVKVLITWAAAWTALENCMWASPMVHEVADLLPPRCAHLAQDDLHYWRQQGYDVPDKLNHVNRHWAGLCPAHSAGLLGVCYVARGASLGSRVIAAQLQKTLRLNEGRGMSFFAPNAPNDVPAVTWPQWSARLDARLDTPEALALAVLGANATFAALHDSFVDTDHTHAVAS